MGHSKSSNKVHSLGLCIHIFIPHEVYERNSNHVHITSVVISVSNLIQIIIHWARGSPEN